MKRPKKKRNKKKPSVQSVTANPTKYIREYARTSPVYECLIDEKWEETQFSSVVVSRQKKNGSLVVGIFIVDMQCLGVKDTSFDNDMSPDDYQNQIGMMTEKMQVNFVKIEANLCFNIIYGAIEFAEDCGFQPHKDFSISKYILDDVESVEFEEVVFGVNGKPFYAAGPFDNTAKIIATLEKKVGEGNFEVLIDSHELDGPIEDGASDPRLESFFPVETIEKKWKSLADDYATGLYSLQLDLATMVMTVGNFNTEAIKEGYKNKDGFFEHLLEQVILKLNNEREDTKLSQVEEEEIENMTEWVVEKIIAFKGPHFLWQPDYVPFYTGPDMSEFEKLSPDEREMEEEKKLFYMSKSSRDDYMIKSLYLISLDDKMDSVLEDKEEQAKSIEDFLTSLQGKLSTESWGDEVRAHYYDIVRETLDLVLAAEIDEEAK